MRPGILLRVMTLLLGISMAVPIQSRAQPTPSAAPKIKSAPPTMNLADTPRIGEFSANPTSVAQGGTVTFRWRTEPGPGGARIRFIKVTVGTMELYRSESPSGEQRVALPASLEPRPSWAFVLTATNEGGRTTTRTVELAVVADLPNIREFSVNPSGILSGDRVTFRWSTEPAGSSPVVRVVITRGTTEISSSTTARGEYTYTYNLPPSGAQESFVLTATNGAGRFARQSVALDVALPSQLTPGVSAEPPELIPGSPYTLLFTIQNSSAVRLTGIGIKIDVNGGGSGSDAIARPMELRDQVIEPGSNVYRLTQTLPRGMRSLESFTFWVGRWGTTTILHGKTDVEVSRTINIYKVRSSTW